MIGNKNAWKHGQWNTPTWKSWTSMRQRCLNPNNKSYPDYGGRGITICDRWSEFGNFLADMGQREPGTTLDRINNAGHYEPGNCRWATSVEQIHNKRSPRTDAVPLTPETENVAYWPFIRWLRDWQHFGEMDADEIWDRYLVFCAISGHPPKTQRQLYRQITRYGVAKRRLSPTRVNGKYHSPTVYRVLPIEQERAAA